MSTRRSRGSSLVELLVVLAITASAVGAASLYLRPVEAPVQVAAAELEGFLREARARALATTSACRVQPLGPRALRGECAASCGSTSWTGDPNRRLEFPRGVAMTDTGWTVCFNSRGLASANLTVTLVHPEFRSRQVEVLLGGAAREVP